MKHLDLSTCSLFLIMACSASATFAGPKQPSSIKIEIAPSAKPTCQDAINGILNLFLNYTDETPITPDVFLSDRIKSAINNLAAVPADEEGKLSPELSAADRSKHANEIYELIEDFILNFLTSTEYLDNLFETSLLTGPELLKETAEINKWLNEAHRMHSQLHELLRAFEIALQDSLSQIPFENVASSKREAFWNGIIKKNVRSYEMARKRWEIIESKFLDEIRRFQRVLEKRKLSGEQ